MISLKLQFCILFCFAFTFCSFTRINTQTDSLAIKSKENSGNYKVVRYRPKFIGRLPETLHETSGLVFFSGQLWTMNDSGSPPEIFQIDTVTGGILRKIVIGNAINSDWESITHDDSNVYVGDFGNNYGNRKDLCIWKIKKSDLSDLANDTVRAGHIFFSYPDQTDFTSALNHNNFDCEAFFYHNDSLHLFSKDWSDLQTKHYVLPSDTGVYKAKMVEKYNVDGLITDAAINAKGNIVLLGYKNTGGKFWDCFCWLLETDSGNYIFNGRKTRVELGSALHLGQSEGVALKNDDTGWISSESILAGWLFRPAKLFRFDFTGFY